MRNHVESGRNRSQFEGQPSGVRINLESRTNHGAEHEVIRAGSVVCQASCQVRDI